MRKRFIGVLGCLLVLATGAVAQTLQTPKKQILVSQMHFTQDGKRLLAVVSQRNSGAEKISPPWLMSWDVGSGQELSRIPPPGNPFLRVLFSPEGRLFVGPPVPGQEPKPTLRDTATGQPVCTLEWTNTSMSPQVFSADGKLLATNGHITGAVSNVALADAVRLWDITKFYDTSTGKQVPLFVRESEAERLNTTLFSQDNRLVVRVGTKSVDTEKSRPWVVVFDRHTGQRLNAFFIVEKVLRDYQLSPNGRTLIGIPAMQTYRMPPVQIPVWDTQTGELLHSLSLAPGHVNYTDLRFSADSSQLHAFGTSFVQQFRAPFSPHRYWKQTWSVASGQELGNDALPVKAIFSWPALRLTLTHLATSDRLIARASNGNSIQLYEQESGKLLWEKEVDLGS